MSAYHSLGEFFSRMETYGSETDDPWSEYKTRFVKLDRAGRANELSCYDDLLENEHRPTRELGEWITKRRELGHLDNLLRRAKK
jgi:hypothetical protein